MIGGAPAAIAFEPTPQERDVGALAADFARREIAPHVAQWDRAHTFPRALYTLLSDVGLMGLLVPEDYGGAGTGYVAYALAVEEIARVDAGAAVTISVHSMICNAIAQIGDEAQKTQWLPRLAGDAIAAFALTEPEAGSDAAAIRSRARREGDDYVLSGRKQWCTNGSYADLIMAVFRTAEADRGLSSFIVEASTAGVHVEKVTEKLGIRTSNTCDIVFEDARVSVHALLGREGEGLSRALATLAAGRIGIAAQACGILAACLDESVKFARDRVAFGRPIEGISFKIAQMATDLDAARLLTHRAAALAQAGQPFAVDASKAKLFASTAARKHAAEAIQIHGGYGFTTEFPVERFYRDAKITEIYEGTSEIQQLIIARSLLGRAE